MKLISWNVNGVRAATRKDMLKWFEKENPDILCIQETKAHPDQLDPHLLSPLGYQTYWSSAKKKGYSGVSIWTRRQPTQIKEGLGVDEFDFEGRTLIAEFKDFFLINGYFPNGQPDLGRVPYKLRYNDALLERANILRKSGKPLIICGDFNIAHKEIDIARPKENENCSGFLPIERAWMDKFVSQEYVDIFRHFNSDPHHYTWWTYRAGARERNVGWRIDYFFVTPGLVNDVSKSYHQPQVMGSDHCPVVLELKN